MEKNSSGRLFPSKSVEDQIEHILPYFKPWAQVEVEVFSNLPGEWFGPSEWIKLRTHILNIIKNSDLQGIIIVTGTDIIEELAYFLHLTIPTKKPIVLTASLRGIKEFGSDAPLNLVDAVRVAATQHAVGKGVLIVINGKIFSARDAEKTDTQSVAPFAGELGPLGIVDREGVFFYRQLLRRHTFLSEFAKLPIESLPRVEICCAYAGADGFSVRSALAVGARGIVIAALGSGNVSRELGEALIDAITNGVYVVISTQVKNGRVSPIYHYPGGGGFLASAGCVFADNLSPLKARVLLMVAIQASVPKEDLKRIFTEY